ncbi:MAG: enoyl-CoA hydratase-related protein [Aromatoleum sp.]|jgi:crotonobetainyl-CoA hydratase|uniref:enoyl-CoA hydratase-related protein n=1 Tax=Aromatoleum sp. TaxID=2307007 RepID=UPI002896296C|nr:enoyl-CoA hydratase-related protein [Aromatoleum sp.]MDT3671248.1 enoyl-CoA hydratase-related protein [Aromatoleum sp.]
MTDKTVLFEPRGRVAIITINRPDAMNAVNGQVWKELGEAFECFAGNAELWAAVVTGAGDKAFCAGADLKAAAAGELLGAHETSTGGFAGLVRRYTDKPVIAAVNGVALGGGAEIAMFCDLIVASERAKLGLPEVKRGVMAIGGGLLRLPRVVPLKVAMYHIMTGDPMSAADALRWGLVNEVVPHDQVLDAAITLAERICTNAPLAVRASKDVVYRTLETSVDFSDASWEISNRLAARNRESEDAKEGPRAFAEKRPPVWQGR